MIGDEAEAIQKSKRLFELGIMVIGFGFPAAIRMRLRVQVSEFLQQEHIDRILDAFAVALMAFSKSWLNVVGDQVGLVGQHFRFAWCPEIDFGLPVSGRFRALRVKRN